LEIFLVIFPSSYRGFLYTFALYYSNTSMAFLTLLEGERGAVYLVWWYWGGRAMFFGVRGWAIQ
jgi:hypothetical protein